MMSNRFRGLLAKTFAAAAMAAALSLSTYAAPAWAAAAAPVTKTPAPKILVIDRAAILSQSKVGQDIARQVRAYTEAAEKEFKGESDALKRERTQLEQQAAILSADAKKQKLAAFQKQAEAFQAKVQHRQELIQGGVIKARQQVEQALGPILQGVMAERGANLLLDRNVVILGTVDVDVTPVVIARLNKKLPAVKVDLVMPPANMLQQQPPAQ
ncbi:MAG: OmpH family outer membrane protein [Alphaproteobacteria bacterium]|nr:OmpH family outer membrane protein [Alphaproteobacteria bacterium]